MKAYSEARLLCTMPGISHFCAANPRATDGHLCFDFPFTFRGLTQRSASDLPMRPGIMIHYLYCPASPLSNTLKSTSAHPWSILDPVAQKAHGLSISLRDLSKPNPSQSASRAQLQRPSLSCHSDLSEDTPPRSRFRRDSDGRSCSGSAHAQVEHNAAG